MIILGLTGSIGMGKSTTADLFAKEGVPVFDVDAVIHQLYEEDQELIDKIAQVFPVAKQNGKIDRSVLAELVRGHKDALSALESIVHPAIARVRADWLQAAKNRNEAFVLFDIPLLFETGGESKVDKIIVVSTSPEEQKRRVLARPGMTEARFEHFLSRQMPDEEKRRHADFVINTSKGLEDAAQQVQSILRQLKT
ncbi:MAG: dephospho-CoA kinase [Robiginitomaculum sp.]|nr:dephospho-CoA kinase [Robiginitomaculum sp.]MDQ7078901.1 dephospho-CoA kinase [Robiginitomaculum sp.]